ncbi:cation diffusion facilitator family transporter [Geomonas sp. RF6]|uniref:cation diffusion facilitator family transporter n=1 Tax=Geomonas sp. RF6 TaxID=2897342 RepID=UPI001E39C817|nr:cation diffusion facilitator family transporter [Geomonas sp. RF6]UFS69159.1 cation diffusion facilitator family transporter [Geomonas sp. RF6]
MNQQLKLRAARISILSNTTLIAIKLAAGFAMHSVSVVSEAVHSAIDLTAAFIAWFSIRESGKPADAKHNFGHGKIENVAGTIEAILIFGAALIIMWEAGRKLVTGNVEVEQIGVGLFVMLLSAGANFFVSRHLSKVAKETDSVALEADAQHLRTDVYTSLGVVAGLVAIKLTGVKLLDPVVAIVVACLILKTAFEMTKEAFSPILDAKLPDADEEVIHKVLDDYAGEYVEYHNLRTRKAGSLRYIDMHLVVARGMTVQEGHELSDKITGRIKELLPNSHVLVHIEPCGDTCVICEQECGK